MPGASRNAIERAQRERNGSSKANKLRGLRAAARAQRSAMRDMVRAKNRLRAVYRTRGIQVDAEVYAPKERAASEGKLPSAERKLPEQLAEHLDAKVASYKRAKEWLETEAEKVPEVTRLRTRTGARRDQCIPGRRDGDHAGTISDEASVLELLRPGDRDSLVGELDPRQENRPLDAVAK